MDLEFVSKTGARAEYWLTAGHVIRARSWIYRGRWHLDIWIRNDDGAEWRTGSLLGVDVTLGQRIACAWYAANGRQAGDLAAVKNCATGESRVISQDIGLYFDEHRYGRQAAIGALLLAAAIWFGGLMTLFPPVVSANPIAALAILVSSVGLIGFCFSCAANPDHDRVIDQNIQVGLEAMYQAWHQIQSDRPVPRNRPRRSKRDAGQRRIEHASS